MLPALYIVATPIGNKKDITFRAIEVLQSVNIIAAEDKRHSAPLLSHYNINTPMIAVHEHNEQKMADQLLQRLQTGESVALISDAGTPLISDPGFHLVTRVRDAGFPVVPVVGASALIAALSVAGIATDHFTFMGYLPAKKTARCQQLSEIKNHSYTHVFYETPHRIEQSVEDMLTVLGAQRRITIARELTKAFETIKTASVAEIQVWMKNDSNQHRGEFVVVVAGADKAAQLQTIDAQTEAWMEALLKELPVNKVASLVAKLTLYTKKVVYQHALTLQEKQ